MAVALKVSNQAGKLWNISMLGRTRVRCMLISSLRGHMQHHFLSKKWFLSLRNSDLFTILKYKHISHSHIFPFFMHDFKAVPFYYLVEVQMFYLSGFDKVFGCSKFEVIIIE